MKHRAFTIVELVLVLGVVSVVTAVGFITLDPYKGIKLNAAAQKVQTDIKYAKSLAMSVVKWHGVEFSEAPMSRLDENDKMFALPLVESPAYAETVATPTMDPTSGLYTSDITVTLSCSTPYAVIRYTTDGSDPNQSWKGDQYYNPIPVTGNGTIMTIRARAFRWGWTRSNLASETYTIQYSGSTTTTTTTATTTTTSSTSTTMATTTTTTATTTSTTTTTTTTATTTTTTTTGTGSTTTTLMDFNYYRLYEIDGGSEITIVDPANLGKLFIVDISELYSGVTISNVYIPGGGGNKVKFNALGRPYGDTGGPLSAEAVVTLSYKGLSREIRIAPETGRIYIQ